MTKEHIRSRAWRERLGLTQAQLAELTGYSPKSIFWFEKGMTPPLRNGNDREIREWVWQRWKMACSGAERKLKGESFNW